MAKSPDSVGPSQRQLRVGELLRKVLADVFLREDLQDDALSGVIFGVSEVSVSPDMRNATAFISPLGEVDTDLLIAALMRRRKYIRGIVARQIDLKYMPELSFKLDDSMGRAQRIDELLNSPKVTQDLK